jgi:flagellar protein FliS
MVSNMTPSARDAYLETQVMTATPQQLQLLLIDAAIRSAQLGQKHWETGNDEAAGDALLHAQEVLSELMASVGVAKSDISRRLAGIYIFLFRILTEAHLQRNEKKLADVIRVLMIERGTWSLVCEKFGTTQVADVAPASMELNAANLAALKPVEAKPIAVPAVPVAAPAVPVAPAAGGFDSSQMMPVATPPRRQAPIGFPTRDLPAPASGISFEA